MQRRDQPRRPARGASAEGVREGFWLSAPAAEVAERLQVEPISLEEGRLLLRNPYLSLGLVEQLLEIKDFRASYRWRRDLARHSLVPIPTAMSLISGLYWRDLAVLALDVSVRPQLRRQADQLVLQRLPKLAIGERIALARSASQLMIAELRKDPNPRVFGSLLENPRLTEGDLMPVVVSGGHPATLRVLLQDRRWGVRYNLRLAMVRNSRTPAELALSVLPSLNKVDLRTLTRDPRVLEVVKLRCRVLLGERP